MKKNYFECTGTLIATQCTTTATNAVRQFTLKVNDQNYTFTMSTSRYNFDPQWLENPVFSKINPKVEVVFVIESDNTFIVFDVTETSQKEHQPIQQITDSEDLPF